MNTLALLAAVVITYDTGGTLGEYLRAAQDHPAIVQGYCASACTAYLGNPATCVYPSARLAFHQARNLDGSRNLLGTIMLQAQYPRGVLAWVRERGGLTEQLMPMSGAEAIRLGVRQCRAQLARRVRALIYSQTKV